MRCPIGTLNTTYGGDLRVEGKLGCGQRSRIVSVVICENIGAFTVVLESTLDGVPVAATISRAVLSTNAGGRCVSLHLWLARTRNVCCAFAAPLSAHSCEGTPLLESTGHGDSARRTS